MRRSAFLGVTFVTLGILASCAPPVVKHYRPLLQDLQKQSALEETVKRSIGLPSVAVEKAKVPEVRKQFGFSNDPKLPTEILSEISLALFYGLDENNTLMVYFDNGHRMIGYEWGSQ